MGAIAALERLWKYEDGTGVTENEALLVAAVAGEVDIGPE